jgi:hypothetical protein
MSKNKGLQIFVKMDLKCSTYGPKHKTERQTVSTNIMLLLSKNTIFANFNQLPKITDNLDRPRSFRFMFRTINTTF